MVTTTLLSLNFNPFNPMNESQFKKAVYDYSNYKGSAVTDLFSFETPWSAVCSIYDANGLCVFNYRKNFVHAYEAKAFADRFIQTKHCRDGVYHVGWSAFNY
jgi:hypothetical protein